MYPAAHNIHTSALPPQRHFLAIAAATRRGDSGPGDGLTAAERRALQAAQEDGDAALALNRQQQAVHAYQQAAAQQKRSRKTQRTRRGAAEYGWSAPSMSSATAPAFTVSGLPPPARGTANAFPQGPLGVDFAVPRTTPSIRKQRTESLPAPLVPMAPVNAAAPAEAPRAKAVQRAAVLDAAHRATLTDGERAALIFKGHEEMMLRHCERLCSAVRAEAAAQRSAMLDMYKASALGALRKAGVVLTDMQVAPVGRLYDSAVWRLTPMKKQRGKVTLPYHKFARGDAVLLSTQDGSLATPESKGDATVARIVGNQAVSSDDEDVLEGDGYRSVQATICSVASTHVDVALPPAASQALAAAAPVTPIRVDRVLREVTSTRQLRAIGLLKDGYTGEMSTAQQTLRGVLFSLPDTPTLAASNPPWARNSEWMHRATTALAVETLNKSQRTAVEQALTGTLTLWQGPPGTGKTRTLLALIRVLCTAGLPEGRPILATADTNAAVDNVVEGLAGCGVRVVRVGLPAKVRPSLEPLTLESLTAKSPEGIKAAALVAAADEAEALAPTFKDVKARARLEAKARSAREQARRLSDSAARAVVSRAQVVAATCAGAADRRLQDITFSIVLIDEAAQATEPSSLVPLTRGASCAVLAGDHKQLPPTVVSRQAVQQGLDVPLFERLQSTGLEPLLLDVQYRSHPGIAVFSSSTFYGGRVRSMVRPEDRPPPRGVPWLNPELPVLFVDVDGKERRPRGMGLLQAGGASAGGGSSFANAEEATVALEYLEMALQGGDVSSAAVLTPYSAQLRLLEEGWRGNTRATPAGVEVTMSSIDGYQGREADMVVMSVVRCNDTQQLGFVADQRRLNVALTRARRGLVVVGNAATLAADPTWARLIQWLRKKGVCVNGGIF